MDIFVESRVGQMDAKMSHLLQPIRWVKPSIFSLFIQLSALAQNWNIDIATELEDYMEELSNIAISFGDGKTLNFAEAALVIQASLYYLSLLLLFL